MYDDSPGAAPPAPRRGRRPGRRPGRGVPKGLPPAADLAAEVRKHGPSVLDGYAPAIDEQIDTRGAADWVGIEPGTVYHRTRRDPPAGQIPWPGADDVYGGSSVWRCRTIVLYRATMLGSGSEGRGRKGPRPPQPWIREHCVKELREQARSLRENGTREDADSAQWHVADPGGQDHLIRWDAGGKMVTVERAADGARRDRRTAADLDRARIEAILAAEALRTGGWTVDRA